MSFFRKLFGGGSFEELRAEGDQQFGDRDFGAAKLAYEKALGKSKGAAAEAIAHVEKRVVESCDALARIRVEEAERLAREDELELARTELESAREIAASRSLKNEITQRMEQLEKTDAREAAEDVADASDDELFEALAGTWSEEQAEEYDALDERFRRAYLALHARDAATALPLLEALAADAKDPRYIWYEVGRARIVAAVRRRDDAAKALQEKNAEASGDPDVKAGASDARSDPETTSAEGAPIEDDQNDGVPEPSTADAAPATPDSEPALDDATTALFRDAEDALRKFLASIGPDEGGVTRLAAHVEIAGLATLRKDDAAAEAELRAATDALPDETRPWLALGQWLRRQKRLDEAHDALMSGVRAMSETVPDIALELELAFLARDRGDDTETIRLLERVLERASRGELDYQPDIAIPLAEAYEKSGQKRRASDVWRHLARGSDVQHHDRYHREAARLLVEIGDEAEAHRMLLRAIELAKTDDARAELKARLEKLGGPRSS